MVSGGASLVILFILSACVAAGLVLLSSFVGRTRVPRERSLPYECGVDPKGEPRRGISINYFLIAVLFIIFSVQIVFLYPVVLLFRYAIAGGEGMFVMIELLIFLAFLTLALVYAWRMKAFNL